MPKATPEPTDYATIAIFAEIVDDLEKSRIANENRLRQLTRSAEDSDGEIRGFGLALDNPKVQDLVQLVAGVAALEKQATKTLEKSMLHHPLGAWVKATTGIGLKQGARLLAATHDPYWNGLHDRPRLVSELWSYCGLRGDQPTVRQRGVVSNWSSDAKMRVFLVAESCMKNRNSPYRSVYDEGRLRYAEATHVGDCKRCGPSGKPALAGSALSDGHKHARAMRLVMKEILRDLWLEGRALHHPELEAIAS